MTWHYLQNQFDNVTKTNFLRMLILTEDHYAKLLAHASDADIEALRDRTEDPHNEYLTAYTEWRSSIAFRMGATAAYNQEVDELRSTGLARWEGMVLTHYAKVTPAYITIFPGGLTAFHSAKQDQVVDLVRGLQLRLAAYPLLATLLAEVTAKHVLLKGLRDAQQGKESVINQKRDDLDIKRRALAVMMYKNLGDLMSKYAETPEYIDNLWELSLLQSSTGAEPDEPTVETFSGTVGAGLTANIASNMAQNSVLILTNTGTTELIFCLANAGATACVEGKLVAAGESTESSLQDLGDLTNIYLNVTNTDGTNTGSYSVEIATP